MTAARLDVADLSLVEAADAVRKGEVSAVSLLEACLANLDSHEEAVNATIWVDREAAFTAARAADAKRAAGGPLGPLHGLPLAHKDMYYQAGRLSSCGSAIRRDFVPDYSATVIERLSAAGAYAFAGLNMAEFAQNGTGHNRHHGDCRNPWNLSYITGGSSSGSGAAVASRFTYAALGSDTGGSIRLPAAANGVSGIKPTQTRVSRYGVMPLSFSADNVGPLARTARDCARIMSVIAGHDPRDPTSAEMPVPDYEAGLTGDLRGHRYRQRPAGNGAGGARHLHQHPAVQLSRPAVDEHSLRLRSERPADRAADQRASVRGSRGAAGGRRLSTRHRLACAPAGDCSGLNNQTLQRQKRQEG